MSQAFYRKWRPRRWESMVGQPHVVDTLRNAVAGERIAHAYLFAGPRGTGKTSAARLLAKAVNCLAENPAERPDDKCEFCEAVNQGRFLDLIEIDAASNTSVDDVRDLREKINFSPNQGRYKVYVIDEVHMLSTAAFNALLKTLEEPPAHAIFILATTEVHKIPATVLSRCQRHEFRRIPVNDIIGQLKLLADGEHIKVASEALALIARQSTGSLRDAISLLDQLASLGKPISLEIAQSVLGTATSQAVLAVVEAVINKDASAGLDQIHKALDSGSDPRQFTRQVVDYLRDLLLIRLSNPQQVEATPELRAQMARQSQAFSTAQLLFVIRAFSRAASEARAAWQPSLPLEMALVESISDPLPAVEMKTDKPLPVQRAAPKPAPIKEKTVEEKAQQSSRQAQAQTPADEPVKAEEVDAEDVQANQDLNQNWKHVLSQVRAVNGNTYGLLNSSKSKLLKGNLLVLGFASDVLKNQMSKKENLEIVQQALKKVLDKDIRVHCTITAARRNAIPPDVDSDGLVAAALRDLGGEIVDVQ